MEEMGAGVRRETHPRESVPGPRLGKTSSNDAAATRLSGQRRNYENTPFDSSGPCRGLARAAAVGRIGL
jgi:hypothetical protein